MRVRYDISRTLMLAGALVLGPTAAVGQSPSDSTSIRAAALNYIAGWYEGDGDRMASALHPKLAKRMVYRDPSGKSMVNDQTAEMLIESTRRGGGSNTPAAEQRTDVTILDIYENVASLRIDAGEWIDYLHLVKFDGEWKIINVLWELRPGT